MNYPAAELRGIRCHAGLVADCKKLSIYISTPADCKKLSIYSQHPSPQGEGTSGNPTASGSGIKKIKAA